MGTRFDEYGKWTDGRRCPDGPTRERVVALIKEREAGEHNTALFHLATDFIDAQRFLDDFDHTVVGKLMADFAESLLSKLERAKCAAPGRPAYCAWFLEHPDGFLAFNVNGDQEQFPTAVDAFLWAISEEK